MRAVIASRPLPPPARPNRPRLEIRHLPAWPRVKRAGLVENDWSAACRLSTMFQHAGNSRPVLCSFARGQTMIDGGRGHPEGAGTADHQPLTLNKQGQHCCCR